MAWLPYSGATQNSSYKYNLFRIENAIWYYRKEIFICFWYQKSFVVAPRRAFIKRWVSYREWFIYFFTLIFIDSMIEFSITFFWKMYQNPLKVFMDIRCRLLMIQYIWLVAQVAQFISDQFLNLIWKRGTVGLVPLRRMSSIRRQTII